MSERRERIPAEEVPEPERWKLPFWTEPDHLVQQEISDDEDEVLVEEEEIEVEPLTADQLEAIRQEAYNEGLQQGLVEGRQKGEKQGHEEGYKDGLKSGEEEGRKLGYDAGFEQGENEAKALSEKTTQTAIQDANQVIERISQDLIQQKQVLEKELPKIIEALAKAVVTEELQQGSEHITHIVQLALNALPLDSSNVEIQIHPNDLPFVEAVQEQSGFSGVLVKNEAMAPGGCIVSSRYSEIDFTASERWNQVIEQYRHQLQLGISTLIEDGGSPDQEEDESAVEKTSPDSLDSTPDTSLLSEENNEALNTAEETQNPIEESDNGKDNELDQSSSEDENSGGTDESH